MLPNNKIEELLKVFDPLERCRGLSETGRKAI